MLLIDRPAPMHWIVLLLLVANERKSFLLLLMQADAPVTMQMEELPGAKFIIELVEFEECQALSIASLAEVLAECQTLT